MDKENIYNCISGDKKKNIQRDSSKTFPITFFRVKTQLAPSNTGIQEDHTRHCLHSTQAAVPSGPWKPSHNRKNWKTAPCSTLGNSDRIQL